MDVTLSAYKSFTVHIGELNNCLFRYRYTHLLNVAYQYQQPVVSIHNLTKSRDSDAPSVSSHSVITWYLKVSQDTPSCWRINNTDTPKEREKPWQAWREVLLMSFVLKVYCTVLLIDGVSLLCAVWCFCMAVEDLQNERSHKTTMTSRSRPSCTCWLRITGTQDLHI